MTDGLARVQSAIAAREPAGEWLEAIAQVTSQRASVEAYLAESDRPRVYGFDTLLGPLDSGPAHNHSQLSLLNAHLQGRQCFLEGELFTAITAVKLEQLSHGGSGIHPDAFRGILTAMSLDEDKYAGAWSDSYSSGDVVPASWWLKNVMDRNPGLRLHAGDVIALINGNFVSTAVGTVAYRSLIGYFSEFLAVSASLVDQYPVQLAPGDVPKRLIEAVWDQRYVRPLPPSPVQRPVSVRDGRLYIEVILATLRQMKAALSDRLDESSGNPLFVIPAGGSTCSLSQSSFLGFNLTQAATSGMQALSLCMGAVHRFTQQKSSRLVAEANEPLLSAVQPPKVSRAILERTRLRFGTLPLSFSGVESGGVEDVWDLSLATTEALREFIGEASSQFQPLKDLNQGEPIVETAHVEQIRRELLEIMK